MISIVITDDGTEAREVLVNLTATREQAKVILQAVSDQLGPPADTKTFRAAEHISHEDGRYPLWLTATGPGSRAQIEEYIRRVITQRTTPDSAASAEDLAHSITTSVLSRLGAEVGPALRGIAPDGSGT